MPLVYQRADIFVLPSLIEGHPKVLLEAMACGLPCLVNDIKSMNRLIEDQKNGLLFNGSARSLKRALKKFLNNYHLASKLGGEARSFIVKNFNFQELIDKEMEILT